MRSLASEHLQEIENLIDSERRKKEEIVKITLGSIFSGDAPNSRIMRIHGPYENPSHWQPVQTPYEFASIFRSSC